MAALNPERTRSIEPRYSLYFAGLLSERVSDTSSRHLSISAIIRWEVSAFNFVWEFISSFIARLNEEISSERPL